MMKPQDYRPRVSVIMSVLRPHPIFFREAVESILRQSMMDWELIIVEDPSPRDGKAILGGIEDPRIRYFTNTQASGLIAQRNRCLAEARAELVAVLDADDIAEADRLAKQVEYLDAHPEIGILGSQISVVDAEGYVRGYRRFPLDCESILLAMRRIVPLSHPSVMYRKNVVTDAGGYKNHEYPHVDDYELYSRLAVRGVRFANHPETLLRYRVHPEMGKMTQLREVIRGVLNVKNRYWRDEFDLRARARVWGERCLLYLPQGLVMNLLLYLLYHDPRPECCEPPRTVDAPAAASHCRV